MVVNQQTFSTEGGPFMVYQRLFYTTQPDILFFFSRDISIKTKIRANLNLFSEMDFISALMNVPRLSPIFLSTCSTRNSTGISGKSIHIGRSETLASEARKPGFHFWTEINVPLRNHGPDERILATSSLEEILEIKNPFPMEEVVFGD